MAWDKSHIHFGSLKISFTWDTSIVGQVPTVHLLDGILVRKPSHNDYRTTHCAMCMCDTQTSLRNDPCWSCRSTLRSAMHISSNEVGLLLARYEMGHINLVQAVQNLHPEQRTTHMSPRLFVKGHYRCIVGHRRRWHLVRSTNDHRLPSEVHTSADRLFYKVSMCICPVWCWSLHLHVCHVWWFLHTIWATSPVT